MADPAPEEGGLPATIEGTSPGCDACGERSAVPFGEERGYRLVRCASCGLIYVDPQPSPEELARLYLERIERGGGSDYYGAYIAARESHERHARRLLSWLERFHPPGRLLEIGCGPGFLLACARARGWEVLGIEPAEPFAGFARERLGLEVVAATLEEADLPAGRFDAVAMLDLLSHLRSPARGLVRAREILAPGGILLVQGGNRGEFEEIPAGADWDTPLHLFHFTRRNLRDSLARAGFEILWMRSEPKASAPRVGRAIARPWMRRILGPPYRRARAALLALRGLDPRDGARIRDRTVYAIARSGSPGPLQPRGADR